ncbi:hypothetical protein CBS101457_005444 [Exobasidium rhododendri]|nr:hypothetical protein CBS101457_005444 [Exobasidium rhododendri]
MSSSSQRDSDDSRGFVLADELALYKDDSYIINNELDASSLPTHLDTLVDSLSLSSSSIDDEETFDKIKSFIRYFSTLQGPQRSKLVDALTSAFGLELDAAARDLESEGIERYKEHTETLEKYAFSLQWLIHSAEKAYNSREERSAAEASSGARGGAAKGKGTGTAISGWDWQRAIPTLLQALTKSLRLSTSILFPLTAAKDAFISGCVLRPVLLLQENENHLKIPAIKLSIFKVICNCVKNHGQAYVVQTSIMQALAYYEHLAEPMAELLALLRIEFDYERLGDEVLREVAAREFGLLDSKSPRCFARFLIRMAELSPRSVLRVIDLLNKHLDSESYPMRNAMLEILGLLIKDLSMTDDPLTTEREQASIQGGDNSEEDQADARQERGMARKKQVEEFWALICERFLDMNSYVRCKCINVCIKLCDLPAKFPAQRNILVDLSVQSLSDKSSSVRKTAIGLLTRLILTHPYGLLHGGELDVVEWTKRLEAIDEQLREFDGVLDMPGEEKETDQTLTADQMQVDEEGEGEEGEDEDEDEDATMAQGEEDDEDDEDDDDETPKPKQSKQQQQQKKPRTSVDVNALAAKLSTADAEKVVRLRLTRRYYVDAIAFIDILAAAIPHLSQLLVSTSKAEVLESMEFFRVAHEYKVPGANVGIRRMIHLIWSKDNNSLVTEDGKELKGIKSRLIEVYRSLYFEPLPTLSARDNVNRIARNLVERTFGATLAELTSLEELVSTMCGEGMIHEDVIEKLWSVYSSSKSIPRGQRRGAIIILSMLSIAKKEIVAEHINTLLGIGLGPLGEKDVVLAKYTCIALSRVGGSVKKVKGALSDEQVRFPMSHPIFARLREAIKWPSGSGQWFSLAEHAIQTIYLLGQQPDDLCSKLIKEMTVKVFGAGGLDSLERETTPTPGDAGSCPPRTQTSAFALAQLLFVVGHVALKQIVYLEMVEREFKRRKAEAERKKGAKEGADASSKKAAAAAAAALEKAGGKSKRGKKGAVQEPSEDAEDELDQVAGNAEDDIGDVVAEVREMELLDRPQTFQTKGSLLAIFGPVTVHICSNPSVYTNGFLRKAAVLTLCKFMCISSNFCEAHLPLVLSILSTSQDAVIRSNVVIALGDMAISFGNLVDENSDKLYAGLSDQDLGVKKHTLMVLTHLILNGMIKVKGQLGEMAKCLEDEEERVSDLAKLFFSELATKENAVYNNLPDIISHLSIGKHAVDEETFGRTMRFIFTFIDKEKQAENVVEKLCQRFRLTSEERQWRDVAFCLSLLPYKSDRSVKRLIEGLPFYQDKLHDAVVFKRFSEILAKARGNRTAIPGSTSNSETELQEFEQILEAARLHGLNDAELEGAATQAKLAKLRRKRDTTATRTSRGRVATRRTARQSVASDADETM